MLASMRRFAGLLLLWSIPGVAVGLQSKSWEQEMGSWGTYRFLFVYAGWAIWAFLTPPLAWLVRRFTVERYGLLRLGAIHLVTCTGFLFFQEGFLALLTRFMGPYSMQKMTLGEALWDSVAKSAFLDTMVYVMTVGVLLAIDLRRKLRAQELTGARLQAELAKAELDALRVQLHPHFLFNTLNSISVLMGEDIAAARHMLTRLSDLLRTSLDGAGRHEVMLKEELDFLASYLEIEQIRFQDRLTVQMNIDPATLAARVPNFILQPLVENAIRHGIAPRATPSSIEIRAVRDNGFVELQVCDNGAGASAAIRESLSKGIGLSNTRARLEQIYGTSHGFDISQPETGGFRVTIKIPFKTEADGPSAKENGGADDSNFNRR